MKLTKIICIIAACAIFIAGCAKPPLEEMNNATEAVTRAENDSDAVLYAANSLARARDALNRMQKEAESKRYDAVKSYAAEAISAAEKAIADGRSGAIRAREEAAGIVAGLKPAILETDQNLHKAQSAGLKMDFNALNRNLDDVKLNAAQAETAMINADYRQAVEKGRNAQAGLSDINRQLSDVVTTVSRKK